MPDPIAKRTIYRFRRMSTMATLCAALFFAGVGAGVAGSFKELVRVDALCALMTGGAVAGAALFMGALWLLGRLEGRAFAVFPFTRSSVVVGEDGLLAHERFVRWSDVTGVEELKRRVPIDGRRTRTDRYVCVILREGPPIRLRRLRGRKQFMRDVLARIARDSTRRATGPPEAVAGRNYRAPPRPAAHELVRIALDPRAHLDLRTDAIARLNSETRAEVVLAIAEPELRRRVGG